SDPADTALRQQITGLWEAVEWSWFRNGTLPYLLWHWSPTNQFAINLPLRGWNEVMIVYILGLASPTHPIPASLYHTGWAGRDDFTNGFSYYGQLLPLGSGLGGPLFFTHYSYIGFNPWGIKDDYANYFLQGRSQTLINRAFCENNAAGYVGYSDVCWGLTASDDPFGYLAHEPRASRDNGTITPTAALSSMPYAPHESIAAMKHFYREHGEQLWGPMGFYDAFNLTENWFATSYLAIDQGPIICMIENYRSGLLWNLFMSNPEIDVALDAAGFMEDPTIINDVEDIREGAVTEVRLAPNPVRHDSRLSLDLRENTRLTIDIVTATGQLQERMIDNEFLAPGPHQWDLSPGDWPAGLYWIKITANNGPTIVQSFFLTD
ncbi:MAG: hypothetical protein KDC54_18690, partial [Lewinella sp.]|nr:hypothetical protein [Lewinella sp.]